jgi:hypothetical protein
MKTGRLPRTFDPNVPHLSSLALTTKPIVLPPALSYTQRLPAGLGMMLNDKLGDCTIAAFYHARQVWTGAHGAMETDPDSDVEALYESACGYVPGNAATDQGGVEQHVLKYLVKAGAPTPKGRDHLLAFFEIDPRNLNDVKRAIYECGVCYIGINVPSNIMPENAPPPAVWTYDPSAKSIGGHAIILTGWNAQGFELISWGQVYHMTEELFRAICDESYALVDKSWINSTGLTPLKMTVYQLENQMKAIKA